MRLEGFFAGWITRSFVRSNLYTYAYSTCCSRSSNFEAAAALLELFGRDRGASETLGDVNYDDKERTDERTDG